MSVERLPPLAVTDMDPEQKRLFAQMQTEIPKSFNVFKVRDSSGRLLGPWNAWLHQPDYGIPIWALSDAVCKDIGLSNRVMQIAILVVGAKLKAAYELYAHSIVAQSIGLSSSEISRLTLGESPQTLNHSEKIAFNIATSLLDGKILPDALYSEGIQLFGDKGLAQIIYIVGFYMLVSVTLNAYKVSIPA